MKARRRHNYRARDTQRSVNLHREVLEWVSLFGEGMTVSELGNALGCSRQLALYHVKKLAASGRLVMVLERCLENNGLRFRIWDEAALAAHYSRRVTRLPSAPKEVRRAA